MIFLGSFFFKIKLSNSYTLYMRQRPKRASSADEA